MPSRFLAAAFATVILSCAYFPAGAASIHCAAAADDVEQAICSHPELLARDQAISVRIDTLKQRCPADQKLLVQGQKFWLRERWDCRNVPGVFDQPGGLSACLASRMDDRLQQLNDIGAGCDFAPLAAAYRFVDVDYLLRFSDRYIGKPVSVFGSIELASCDAPSASPTAATVVGNDRQRDRFRVEFGAMQEGEREFLCARRPSSHWAGTIRHDSNGNYLFVSEIPGV